MRPPVELPAPTHRPDAVFTLRITEAHHRDNRFYDLGQVMHEGSARQLFDMLPDGRHAHAPGDEACYTVDLYADEHGPAETLVADREVTREVAQQLLEELLIQAGHADTAPAYL